MVGSPALWREYRNVSYGGNKSIAACTASNGYGIQGLNRGTPVTPPEYSSA